MRISEWSSDVCSSDLNCQEKREQAARRRDAVEQTFILQGKNHSPSFHISRFEQDRPTSEFHLVGCRRGRGGARPRRGPRRKGRWHRLAGAFLPKIACGGPNSRTRQAFGRNPFLGCFLGDGGRADRKSTRLNSRHSCATRMHSSAGKTN